MNKKNIKLIMELIFIFILPFIFICFTSEIQVQRQFTYDNNGNYEVSQDIKSLSFDNSIIKYTKIEKKPDFTFYNYIEEYLSDEQGLPAILYRMANSNNYIDDDSHYWAYSPNGTIYNGNIDTENTGDFYLFFNKKIFELSNFELNMFLYSSGINEQYISLIYNENNYLTLTYIWYQNPNQNIYIRRELNLLTQDYKEYHDYYTNEDYIAYNLSYFYNWIENSDDITLDVTYYLTTDENNQQVNITNTEYNNYIGYVLDYVENGYDLQVNTIWGNIKQLLITNLDLNDNVLLDIVLCYTILWVIMWIIWHLFYGLFELLWHIIPRKD